MNELILNKKEYTLKTVEGQANLRNYIEEYNSKIDPDDPIAKKISFDEALAITNIEEFIRSKASIAEIIREALEIAFTTANFKTNTVFTFVRKQLKKLNLNSIIRMQIENYIKFRMNYSNKSIEQQKKAKNFDNITSFDLNGEKYYYNILTNEELEGEDLKEYLQFIEDQQCEALPF